MRSNKGEQSATPMNRFLASFVESLNPVIAIFLIVAGAMFGSRVFSPFFFQPAWAVDPRWATLTGALGPLWGAIIGLLLAIPLCGFNAQLAEMRRLLTDIRDQGQPKEDPLNREIEGDILPVFRGEKDD